MQGQRATESDPTISCVRDSRVVQYKINTHSGVNRSFACTLQLVNYIVRQTRDSRVLVLVYIKFHTGQYKLIYL